MRPIAGYSRGRNLAGGRQSASKTGTAQLGDTGENKDAWMVGYTPSLSTAVWVGTEQGLPLRNLYGSPIYGSALPSDIWKETMDGALDGTSNEAFPDPAPIGGQAGVPVHRAQHRAAVDHDDADALQRDAADAAAGGDHAVAGGDPARRDDPGAGRRATGTRPTPGAGGTGGTGGATDQDGGAVTTLEPLPNGGVPRPGTN